MPASPKQRQNHHRQIRATYDSTTITVYQAYNSSIASAATSSQRLDASPLFLPTRMTWIKPSWNWTMYRSGYSYKDANQTHILALQLTHKFFRKLLQGSIVNDDDNTTTTTTTNTNSSSSSSTTDNQSNSAGKGNSAFPPRVRVQWDPERSVRANATLPPDAEGRSVRSIQIGVPGELVGEMVSEGIVGIEDVTGRARALKEYLHGCDMEKKAVKEDELVEMGLLPRERVYELPEDVAVLLGITD